MRERRRKTCRASVLILIPLYFSLFRERSDQVGIVGSLLRSGTFGAGWHYCYISYVYCVCVCVTSLVSQTNFPGSKVTSEHIYIYSLASLAGVAHLFAHVDRVARSIHLSTHYLRCNLGSADPLSRSAVVVAAEDRRTLFNVQRTPTSLFDGLGKVIASLSLNLSWCH